MRTSILAVTFGLGLLAVACGTSSPGLSRTDFATQYCALVKPCCDMGAAGGCANAIASFVPATFDGVEAQTCLDAVRASSSSAGFCNRGAYLADHNACESLSTAHGSVPVGGSCNDATSRKECATSPDGPVGCVYGDGGAICSVQLRGDEGATPCIADTDADGSIPPGVSVGSVPLKAYYCDLSKGLHCDAGGTCVKPSAIGEACHANAYECVSGAYCDTTTTHECKATLALGAGCAFNACGPDGYCDPTTMPQSICKALGANGDACIGAVSCASGYCNASHVCAVGFEGSIGRELCAN